ncbi:MAG: HAMP domain-containing histidine kinase [Rhodobacteraceae bacterium]|nr:HAMP domain-containing histidine kinase [Paracoccaceae bacterium]
MSTKARSLSRILTRTLLLALGVALTLGTAISVYIAQAEYDELLDVALITKAQLMLPLLSAEESLPAAAPRHDFSQIPGLNVDENEKAVFWLTDTSGAILRQSEYSRADLDPADVTQPGFSTLKGYRFFVTEANTNGHMLKVGEPLVERNEAALDSLMGIAFSMAVLSLVAFAVMRRSIVQVQASVARLSSDIGRRDEHNLAPIDATGALGEMTPAVDTVNALMARLSKAVEAERSFATNAAHELRTPLAVSLAHTQRLKAATTDPALQDRAGAIEAGLKKLIHLVERLLQFSRAQSGLGAAEETSDANAVIRLLLTEVAERSDGTRAFDVTMPEGQFLSSIDPDALAIILSNLIDNAVKYGRPGAPVTLDAASPGQVTVANDCDPLTADDLAKINQRFIRRSSAMDGYGIGLSIVHSLCAQSGASVVFRSPRPGSDGGFAATLTLP